MVVVIETGCGDDRSEARKMWYHDDGGEAEKGVVMVVKQARCDGCGGGGGGGGDDEVGVRNNLRHFLPSE
ncbi:hypothetical protein E2C01_078832 [Portunus trituberculatus]|uniref:Uncharacterized protein n=1 Tax=Portunus trituberculatus TaxID=210409 RepID=A0A5B7INR2_PORTR|nr:hypothetical protein [Portunus trituberculatus]